jgi:ribosomal protein S18 acetylase RimI-like enzyme
MALIDRDEAMARLTPYIAGVPSVFRSSWQRVRTAEPKDLQDRSITATAQLMHDYSVADLKEHWKDNSSVRFCEISQQALFVIETTFALRVKKLDDASRSSNHRSPQDDNFRGQGQIEELDHPTHNLELGYILDLTETKISDVRVLCINGRRPYWSQSIERPSDDLYDLFAGQRDPSSPTPRISPAGASVSIEPKKR